MSDTKRSVVTKVLVKLTPEEVQQLDEDGWIRLDGTIYLEKCKELEKENP